MQIKKVGFKENMYTPVFFLVMDPAGMQQHAYQMLSSLKKKIKKKCQCQGHYGLPESPGSGQPPTVPSLLVVPHHQRKVGSWLELCVQRGGEYSVGL